MMTNRRFRETGGFLISPLTFKIILGDGNRASLKTRFSFLILFALSFFLAGCFSYRTNLSSNADYFKRMQSQTQEGLTVRVTGLSAKETKDALGVDLTKKNILPIWIEVDNQEPDTTFCFFERHVDPAYYTPREVAYISRKRVAKTIQRFLPSLLHFLTWPLYPIESLWAATGDANFERALKQHAFPHGWIGSGKKKSGFVFIPYELGLKEIRIDMEGFRQEQISQSGTPLIKKFYFTIKIPGIRQDYLEKVFDSYYCPEERVPLDTEAELIRYVESLPCCTTNRKSSKRGDPLNLVVIGTKEDILTAFTAARWDETETIYWNSIWKMIASFFLKKTYRYSPVSPLYYLGRSQDVAFQKARNTIDQRMHMRLWYSPARFRGRNLWVGTVSRDIGIKFTAKTWNLMTHKIGPDIDDAVFYTLNDLIAAEQIKTYALIKSIPPSTEAHPSCNLTDDPYFTDGTRGILVLSEMRVEDIPIPMTKVAEL
jgi:hypothetical protein